MGAKAPLHFKSAHLHHQRLQLRLTGNSAKGLRPLPSDRNHLFKVAHAMIPVCNQQGPAGPWGSTAGRLLASYRLYLAPPNLRKRGETAPSRERLPAAAGPGTNAPGPGCCCCCCGRGGGPEEAVSDRTGLRARARGGRGRGARPYKPRAAQRAGLGGSAESASAGRRRRRQLARERRGGSREQTPGRVAPVHRRGCPGSRPTSEAGPGCGTRSGLRR